jgi:acyl dehydratase
MVDLTLKQTLPIYEVVAYNYAFDSDNRIHGDEVAAQYGFAGGLVPGVGVYAYLTRPVVDALGREWLARGAMTAKFIHPVYHGEKVKVCATVSSLDSLTLQLELFNAANKLCAVGQASLPTRLPALNLSDYPAQPLPNERRAATIAALPVGAVLGSLAFVLDLAGAGAEFLAKVVETAPLYRGENAVAHPAFLPAQANELLMRNSALGPWIHTASATQHYALARDGEALSLRGRVVESYERRGHEIIVADLTLCGAEQRLIARIKHSAIIKLADPGRKS